MLVVPQGESIWKGDQANAVREQKLESPKYYVQRSSGVRSLQPRIKPFKIFYSKYKKARDHGLKCSFVLFKKCSLLRYSSVQSKIKKVEHDDRKRKIFYSIVHDGQESSIF